MGQSTTPKALALGVSLSLACGLLPGAAFAEESSVEDAATRADAATPSDETAKPAGYDKADFYSDKANTILTRSIAIPFALVPVNLSDEMKYFARYESNQNYDQGLSSGDGYHAMGYYQFDNRYALGGFLSACFNYNPATYSMFAWVPNVDISGDMYDGNAGGLSTIGQRLNDSWHAAYAANPTEFAELQDSYAYTNYFVPAQNYLEGRGIDISQRADCVKGLCWGLANLFGTSGWHKFVGGYSDGYVDGAYYNSYNYPGAGLTNDMTDEQFVTTLCDYVVAHVGEFYAGQPQYHEGWENRYREEKKTCLNLLASQPPNVEAPPADPVVPPVVEKPADPVVPPVVEKPADPVVPPVVEKPADPVVPPVVDKPADPVVPPVVEKPADPVVPPVVDKPADPVVPPVVEQPDATAPSETVMPQPKPDPSTDTAVPDDHNNKPSNLGTDPSNPNTTTKMESESPQEPSDVPAASENKDDASKTSTLSQTGDNLAKEPLGVALVSAGAAAIAGAALVTRRILK